MSHPEEDFGEDYEMYETSKFNTFDMNEFLNKGNFIEEIFIDFLGSKIEIILDNILFLSTVGTYVTLSGEKLREMIQAHKAGCKILINAEIYTIIVTYRK